MESMLHRWVDTHCHLEMLKGDLDGHLQKSLGMGVTAAFTIGTDHSSNQEVLSLTKRYPFVWGALGCHPHEAKDFKISHGEWLRQAAENNLKVLGIGECGYDLFYQHSTIQDQRKVFVFQLELAAELELPLVIHTREADDETISTMQPFLGDGIHGIFHSFTSSEKLAKFALDAGFYISFNGIVTFPKSESVRKILHLTPLDRILLETDAPFLAPTPFRGLQNYPGNVSLVGKYVANALGISQEELSQHVDRNIRTLFKRYQP